MNQKVRVMTIGNAHFSKGDLTFVVFFLFLQNIIILFSIIVSVIYQVFGVSFEQC